MTSSAKRALLGIAEGSVDGCRVLARGSIKMLKREGERVDPCGTPIVQSADVLVTSPALVRIDGHNEDWIIVTIFRESCDVHSARSRRRSTES